MRWLAFALFLLLITATAPGYPLQSGNGIINCTIFGTFKDPGFGGYSSSGSYSVLVVDACLTRTNESDKAPVLADYSLTDGNDRVFRASSDYIKELQNGRMLIGFVVPKETIAKSLTIDLSKDRTAGEQFTQRFPELVNASDANVTLLYYGVLRSSTSSNKKTVELDVAVTNNNTKKMAIDASYFTLKDQWGWKYESLEYGSSTRGDTKPLELQPNETIRSSLLFSSLSPLSRPVELDYRYSDNNSLAMNIDLDAGLTSAAPRSEKCVDCESPEEKTSSLAGSIKASKARLAKVKKLNSSEESTPKGHDEL